MASDENPSDQNTDICSDNEQQVFDASFLLSFVLNYIYMCITVCVCGCVCKCLHALFHVSLVFFGLFPVLNYNLVLLREPGNPLPIPSIRLKSST